MKKIIVSLLIFSLLIGCTTLRPNESWENLLNNRPHPIIVISVSSDQNLCPSILFKDAKGKLFTINGPQYKSFKVGDIIY